MDLVEVHVVGLEALEALIELKEDGFARESAAVGLVAHQSLHLGGDDDGFAPGVGLEKPADDRFAVAAGVDVRGIEEINAEIKSLAQERQAFSLIQRPRLPPRE